jgi:hypothetical protein
MRLVTLRTAEGTRAGRVDGDDVVELGYPDVAAALAADPDLSGLTAGGARAGRVPLAEADLAPLVPRPAKVFCLGLNYASHIEELGHERPEHPTLFGKFPRALIGARDDIVLPTVSEAVDWEVELCLGDRPPGPPRRARPGGGGHRRLHGRQRRLHARLAAPHQPVPAGQDLRGLHPCRAGPGHPGRAGPAGERTWSCAARSTAR